MINFHCFNGNLKCEGPANRPFVQGIGKTSINFGFFPQNVQNQFAFKTRKLNQLKFCILNQTYTDIWIGRCRKIGSNDSVAIATFLRNSFPHRLFRNGSFVVSIYCEQTNDCIDSLCSDGTDNGKNDIYLCNNWCLLGVSIDIFWSNRIRRKFNCFLILFSLWLVYWFFNFVLLLSLSLQLCVTHSLSIVIWWFGVSVAPAWHRSISFTSKTEAISKFIH